MTVYDCGCYSWIRMKCIFIESILLYRISINMGRNGELLIGRLEDISLWMTGDRRYFLSGVRISFCLTAFCAVCLGRKKWSFPILDCCHFAPYINLTRYLFDLKNGGKSGERLHFQWSTEGRVARFRSPSSTLSQLGHAFHLFPPRVGTAFLSKDYVYAAPSSVQNKRRVPKYQGIIYRQSTQCLFVVGIY